MRFIHAADLHIDSPLRGLSRYPGAPLERLRGATRRALERLVDFPAFRESLKTELTARLMAEMRDDPRAADSVLGGLGMLLGPMLVDGAVEALVTPPTIAAMVRNAEAPDPVEDPLHDPEDVHRLVRDPPGGSGKFAPAPTHI